jgi:hypothetical protein
MGQSGAYITLSINSMSGSWLSCFIHSCTVPLLRVVSPPDMPFRVVFCIGVGWFIKYLMYGVTQQYAPESTIACEISYAQALLNMSIAILSNALL